MKRCSKCKTEKHLEDFYIQKSGRRAGQPTARCKGCQSAQSKAYYAANTEKSKAAHKGWVSRNKDRVKKHKIKATFGIEPHEYDAMPKVCVICGAVDDLCVDHSHRSGRVRGLLCSPCNKGLGFFKDNPALLLRASDYLLGVAKPDIFAATYDTAD